MREKRDLVLGMQGRNRASRRIEEAVVRVMKRG